MGCGTRCYARAVANSGPMPWWQIIAILIVVALVVGAVVGVLSSLLGFSSTWSAPAIGAAIGVFAAALISRRRSSP
jgi:membrane associated rhomboid family serine protease